MEMRTTLITQTPRDGANLIFCVPGTRSGLKAVWRHATIGRPQRIPIDDTLRTSALVVKAVGMSAALPTLKAGLVAAGLRLPTP